MKALKIVKEENTVISINKVDLREGFIIITADGYNRGIIVYDSYDEEFKFINNFYDSFSIGIEFELVNSRLSCLMEDIEDAYSGKVEFVFIPVE